MNKGNWGKVRAFFDLQTEEGFTIKGFKLVEGINGLFVGFPSQKGNDEEYHDTIWADRDLKDEVTQLAVKTFGQDIMNQNDSPNASETPVFNENNDPEQKEKLPPSPTQDDVTVQPFSEDDIPF